MAFLDLRRMVRNYLPIKYRENLMELFMHTLVSPFEDMISRIEEDRRSFESERLIPLTIYSFEVVKRRIWDLYGIDEADQSVFPKSITLYESIYGRIVNVRFGTNYPHDTNYHYARIKDFFPAGILINIEYD